MDYFSTRSSFSNYYVEIVQVAIGIMKNQHFFTILFNLPYNFQLLLTLNSGQETN